ncbi:RdgB/HAM1 family non-canonical purine NTP pyrophosphatase [Acidihalobacter prosperus]
MSVSLLKGIERIVLATGNPGKVDELNALLADSGIDILAQTHFGIPEAKETGLSFIENALIKARNASLHTGLPAIADDSGLEVDALNGAPGIYSARYAGNAANDEHNNRKLLAVLEGLPPHLRSARFKCVMVFLRHPGDSSPIVAKGEWKGSILTMPAGNGGFGYDPIFNVAETNCSAAELDAAKKNRISHRGQALRALLAAMKTGLTTFGHV